MTILDLILFFKKLALKKVKRAIAFVPLLLAPWSQWELAQGESPNDFLHQCLQLDQLSRETKQTIRVLLTLSNTDDCQIANQALMQQTELDMSDRQITDLTPVASFTQLESLRLGQNEISELSPLTALTQLRKLYLLDNNIVDIQPLGQLNQLQTLDLDNNQIQDLSPLSNLTNLTILFANSNQIRSLEAIATLSSLEELYIANNQINDGEILRSLPQLTHLDLGNNRLNNSSALATLTHLIQLDISGNQITNIDALSSLQTLVEFNLQNNPLAQKRCPIFPATVCLFSDDAADLYQLGQHQLAEGNWAAALDTFQSALQVYQQNGDRLRQSDALDRIGNVYDELGEYANAFDVYQQGATIRQTAGDRQGQSETLTNLGITYIRIGQFDQAITSLEQAWSFYQTLERGDRSWLRPELRAGVILSGLALAYSKIGDPDKSLQFAKQSLAEYRRGRDRQGEAIALNRVGQAYLDLGNLDKARLYLEKAQSLTQAESDIVGLAQSWQNLGNLAAKMGETAIALQRYQQAQTLWQSLDQPAAEGDSLNAIGKILLATHQPEDAVVALEAVVKLWESLRPGLTDADKISITDIQAETYRLLQQALVAAGEPEKALAVSERGRGRAFAELLAHRLALRGRSLPASSAFAPTTIPPTIDQIRQIAQTQQATLVEYSLVTDALYIWVVEPTGTIHFQQHRLDQKALVKKIRDNRLALGVPGRGITFESITLQPNVEADQQPLYDLYQLLIEPISPLLLADPNSPVIIIPQEELFLVPFAALPDSPAADSLDLIDRHALLFAPTLSLFAPNSQHSFSPLLPIGTAPALVVGNPTMPIDPATGQKLNPLLGAEREALAIAPILDTSSLIGAAATKSVVVADLAEVAIAHFATHGLLDDFGTDIPGALALAPTTEDDGFLTAAEIAELPLSAQLVVLSACDTGRGTITGDGVVGLSRSFLSAGVDNVIVSLWAVDDDSTAYLMTEFYTQLQQQSNVAIALRQAMLKTRSQFPRASDWAAFSVFGRIKK